MMDKVRGDKYSLVVTRGKTCEHLGMTFNFVLKMDVSVTQCDFIKKMFSELPDDLKGPCKVIPAPKDLF